MKAIINGVRYDTDKAIPIGSSCSHEGRGDFRFWTATLYKTPRSGRYFLAGEGGAMSRFSVSRGINSWSGGEGIHPMDEDEAFAWAQAELATAEVEAHFPDLIEDA